MAETTNALLFTRHPQFVVESVEGTTPSTPGFANIGDVQSLSIKKDGQYTDLSQLGTEDLVDLITGLKTFEIQIIFAVENSTFLKRCINSANYATQAGTISESITIMFSFYLDGTESWVYITGARCKQIAMKAVKGKELSFTADFEAMGIGAPTTEIAGSTYGTIGAGPVWDWLTGGAQPLSVDSTQIDATEFNVTIARNTTPAHILGNASPHSTQSHGRRIAGDYMNLFTDTAQEAEFDSPTAAGVPISYVLKTSVSTLSITGAKLVSYTRDGDSNSDEPTVEQVGFRAKAVSIN